MSAFNELYEKVAADKGLQAQFAAILADAQKAGKDETEKKLLSFAKEAGYEITMEEVKNAAASLSDSAKTNALSDAELDLVAGGKSMVGTLSIIASVASLGLTCAFTSAIQGIINAVDNEASTCADVFE